MGRMQNQRTIKRLDRLTIRRERILKHIKGINGQQYSKYILKQNLTINGISWGGAFLGSILPMLFIFETVTNTKYEELFTLAIYFNIFWVLFCIVLTVKLTGIVSYQLDQLEVAIKFYDDMKRKITGNTL